MASIYDKALKRRDYSGIIDKEKLKQEAEKKASEMKGKSSKKKTKEEKKREKEASAKADDPRAGADTGKIVNLMAGDANRVSRQVSSSHSPPDVLMSSLPISFLEHTFSTEV